MWRAAPGTDPRGRIGGLPRSLLFVVLTLIALGAIAVAVPPWISFVTGTEVSSVGVVSVKAPGQPAEIIGLVAGRPAERAGLRKGDRILRIDGEDVRALTLPEVRSRLRGPEGRQVDLVILRAGEELGFSMIRERYLAPNADAVALGISSVLWAALLLGIAIPGTAVTLGVAAFLFSRRAGGSFVSLTALALVYFAAGVMIGPVNQSLGWDWLKVLVFAITWVLGMAVGLRFPDGRYVPRAAAVGLVLVVGVELARVVAFLAGSGVDPDPIRIGELALIASGVLAQAYRYRRVSTPIQRQQTKWFVFGLAILLGAASTGLLPLVVPEIRVAGSAEGGAYFLLSYGATTVGLAGAALAIAFGILKYRLFDIDLIINRALVYGSATAILAGAFAGLSTIAQHLLVVMTGASSEAVSVIIAVVVTAAFVPLKNRVQRIVDRRLKGEPAPQVAPIEAKAST